MRLYEYKNGGIILGEYRAAYNRIRGIDLKSCSGVVIRNASEKCSIFKGSVQIKSLGEYKGCKSKNFIAIKDGYVFFHSKFDPTQVRYFKYSNNHHTKFTSSGMPINSTPYAKFKTLHYFQFLLIVNKDLDDKPQLKSENLEFRNSEEFNELKQIA